LWRLSPPIDLDDSPDQLRTPELVTVMAITFNEIAIDLQDSDSSPFLVDEESEITV
jgi:hypothetical protein